MLSISGLDGYYGNSRALQEIALKVEQGGFLSVLGRNGVGKTTLMRSILGLLDKTRGSIALDGREINGLPTHERARAGIGYVPQGRGIMPRFTVLENLRMGLFARSNVPKEDLELAAFEMFPILKEFAHRLGGDLSGGQQQQLAIARALQSNPKIILLDEPTEGIQPNIVERIQEAIISLNRDRGITIVLVEQDIAFARASSSSFAILEKGRLVASGASADLTDQLVEKHLAV
nr:urea ABC transporter ATP-binding subunit UrtE [uncultured Devosia sp.]